MKKPPRSSAPRRLFSYFIFSRKRQIKAYVQKELNVLTFGAVQNHRKPMPLVHVVCGDDAFAVDK